MTDFERVLINRDNFTPAEAHSELLKARERVTSIIDHKGTYEDVAEFLEYYYMLEMDYIFDLLI